MKYGIVGSGDATAAAVHEALADILKKDKKAQFLIHARRKPQGAVPHVFDFLVDNECKFTSFTRVDDNAPKPLINMSQEAHTVEDPMKAILHEAEQILLLWDEAEPANSERIAIMCADEGLSILDLSMALTPIVVDTPETAEKPTSAAVSTEEDNAIVEFTREELMGMTVGVLRRQAKAMGLDMSRASKDEIVEVILGGGMPEVASDVHVPTVVDTTLSGALVYTEGGVIKMLPLETEVVASLLGRG